MSYLTAHYDEYNQPQKNLAVTEAELVLIQTICAPPARILDIGCGTGRHLIPLTQINYSVLGIDINPDMLRQLQQKLPDTHAIPADITAANLELPENNFALIISMWNSFNEYALTHEAAQTALGNMRKHVASSGKILINIENAEQLDVQKLNYETKYFSGTNNYFLKSELINYDERNNISTCRETVRVEQPNGTVKTFTGEVMQKWWRTVELTTIAAKVGLKLETNLKLTVNTEHYLVFSAQN